MKSLIKELWLIEKSFWYPIYGTSFKLSQNLYISKKENTNLLEEKDIIKLDIMDPSEELINKSGMKRKEFYENFKDYARSISFNYGLKVGRNFQYGNFYQLLKFILKFIDKRYGFPKYSDGNIPSILQSPGTSWSGIGIG